MRPIGLLICVLAAGCGSDSGDQSRDQITALERRIEAIEERHQADQQSQAETIATLEQAIARLQDQRPGSDSDTLTARAVSIVDETGFERITLDGAAASIVLQTRLSGTQRVASRVEIRATEIDASLHLATLGTERLLIESTMSQAHVSISDLKKTERVGIGHYPKIGASRLMLSDRSGQARFAATYMNKPVEALEGVSDFTSVITMDRSGRTKIIALDGIDEN